MGLFGDLFDFDGNGKLNALESATEFSVFMNLLDTEDVDTDEEDAEEDF